MTKIDAEEGAPVVEHRRWKHALVALYLVVQFALPAHYYLFSDPYDERFAWRMYSPMRMVKCNAQVFEGQGGTRKTIKLSGEVGMPWVKGIRRGKLRVLKAFAERKCAELREQGRDAHLYATIRCNLPDGTQDVRADPSEDLCKP